MSRRGRAGLSGRAVGHRACAGHRAPPSRAAPPMPMRLRAAVDRAGRRIARIAPADRHHCAGSTPSASAAAQHDHGLVAGADVVGAALHDHRAVRLTRTRASPGKRAQKVLAIDIPRPSVQTPSCLGISWRRRQPNTSAASA